MEENIEKKKSNRSERERESEIERMREEMSEVRGERR